MRSRHLSLLIITCFAVSLFRPAVGRAEPDLERAQELAFEAQIRVQKSEFKASIALYQKAYKLYPDREFLFAIASLYRRVDKACAQELESWGRFFSTCEGCAKEAKAKERFNAARARCQASLTVTCQPAAPVLLGGVLKGSSPQEITGLDPGGYEVQCGRSVNSVTRRVTLAPQEKKSVQLTLYKAPSKSRELSALEWGVAGGGATALGVGLYLLLHQLPSKLEQRDQEESALLSSGLMGSEQQLTLVKDLDQEAKSAETWGAVSLGVSAALLGGALYMVWPKLAPVPSASVGSGGSAEVSLKWSW